MDRTDSRELIITISSESLAQDVKLIDSLRRGLLLFNFSFTLIIDPSVNGSDW